jgi:hypothetical protein
MKRSNALPSARAWGSELTHMRSIQVKRPFDCHLLFYMKSDTLRIERVMHGARDFPNRLMEGPEG